MNAFLTRFDAWAAFCLIAALWFPPAAGAQDNESLPAEDAEQVGVPSPEGFEAFLRQTDAWLAQLKRQKRQLSAYLRFLLETRDCGMVSALLGTHAANPTPDPYYMARLIEDGRCIERPPPEAIPYYQAAAQHPEHRHQAHARLARAFEQGLGVTRDPKTAKLHLQAAIFFGGRWIPREIIENREPKLSEAFGDLLDPAWQPSEPLAGIIASFKSLAASQPADLLELVLEFCTGEDAGCIGAKLAWLEAMADLLHFAPAKYQYAKHLIDLKTLHCDGDPRCVERIFRPMQSFNFTFVKNLAAAGMLDFYPAINELLSYLENTKPNPSYLKAIAFWCIRNSDMENIASRCSAYDWNAHLSKVDLDMINQFSNSFLYPSLPPLQWHVRD